MRHIKFPSTKEYFVLYEYIGDIVVNCYLFTRKERLPIAYGKSRCSYKDSFNARYGRFVALKRALYAAENRDMAKVFTNFRGNKEDYYGPLADNCIDATSWAEDVGESDRVKELLRRRQREAIAFLNKPRPEK